MFEIVLTVAEQNVWAQARGAESSTKPQLLATIESLEGFTKKVGAAVRRGAAFDEALLAQAHSLHEALFQGELGETFASVKSSEPPLLRLFVDDPRLQKVPWEALCKPGTSEDFLAMGTRFSVARGVLSTEPVISNKVDGALRLLVIAPQEQESGVQALRNALHVAIESGALEWLDPVRGERATAFRILDRLRTGTLPHIIHFIGHGGVDAAGHSTLRLADDEDGDDVWIKAETLGQELKANFSGELRLLVLEACEGAKPGMFGSAADILTRAGASAVVSYLWPVQALASREASKAFYRTLTAGQTGRGDVLASIGAARRTLLSQGAGGFSLVAHLRGATTKLFDLETKLQEPKAPFTVPFLQDKRFVGRKEDLDRLHVLLQRDATIGVSAVTGMGGIGKTQLVVEYAYRRRVDYPGGVYWVNAAADWQGEFARLAEKLGLRDPSVAEHERQRWLARAFVEYLEKRSGALVIFDNVEDPLELQNASRDIVPARLPCRLLFTTRRQTPTFPMVDVRALDDVDALHLLLNTPTRRHVLEGGSAEELATARSICKTLGNLPLAIALASAHLDKSPRITLAGYLRGIVEHGALLVTDNAKVDPRELATQHAKAVRATLEEQWSALRASGDAPRILQTAALLGEAEQIPRARLSLLTGLSDEPEEWRDAPLEESLRELSESSLVETLTESVIRLHPLVREFALWKLGHGRAAFSEACATRLADALYDMGRLSNEVERRGVDEVLDDLRAGIGLGEPERQRLATLLRPIDLEAHVFRVLDLQTMPGFFLQQLYNAGSYELRESAKHKLVEMRHSWLSERFLIGTESNALVRTLNARHEVFGIAETINTRSILSASRDQPCRLWDFYTGQCLCIFERHTHSVQSIAVTQDAKFVVSVSADNALGIWDVEAHTIRMIEVHPDSVTKIIIPPSAHFIVSGLKDYKVNIWDLHTGALLRTLEGHSQTVTGAAVTPDHRFLISASLDQTLKLWSLASGECIREFAHHQRSVHAVAVTPNGQCLVSGHHDGSLCVWEIQTGRVIHTLDGHTEIVSSIAITPDGRYAVSGSHDRMVIIWDLETGTLITVLRGHRSRVLAVTITTDGAFAVSTCSHGDLKIWDLCSAYAQPEGQYTVAAHGAAINSVAFRPAVHTVVTGSDDHQVLTWNVHCREPLWGFDIESHPDAVNAVAFSPDGHIVAASNDMVRVTIWDQTVHYFREQDCVIDIDITSDGHRAITASIDGTLAIWELKTGTVERTLRGHDGWANKVVVMPNGREIISACSDYMLRLWEVDSGNMMRIMEGHQDQVSALAVTSSGDWAVSGSWDATIKVWNVNSGHNIRTIEGHTHFVNDVAITPDGQFIVSVSSDRTLRIWDMETGAQVAILAASAGLSCCAVSPDGKTILAGDVAGGLHVLDWHRGNLRIDANGISFENVRA